MPTINFARIRARTGLTQIEFASRFDISLRTVQGWERGARQPDRTACALLRLIDRDHAAVAVLMAAAIA